MALKNKSINSESGDDEYVPVPTNMDTEESNNPNQVYNINNKISSISDFEIQKKIGKSLFLNNCYR